VIFVTLISRTIELDDEGLYERNGLISDVGKVYGVGLGEIVRLAVGTIGFCCRLGLFDEVVNFDADKDSLSRELVLGIDLRASLLRALVGFVEGFIVEKIF